MISIKVFLFFALAAASTVECAPLERRDTVYTCQNTAFPGGRLTISRSKAESSIHAAPLSDAKTKSSYPHRFHNGGGIVWANKHCNNMPKGDNPDRILLEFPVFSDGHLYNFNSKPKDDPGAVRAIFTSPGKDFCGVVAHTTGNAGTLEKCI